jgi:hypothetical protein
MDTGQLGHLALVLPTPANPSSPEWEPPQLQGEKTQGQGRVVVGFM